MLQTELKQVRESKVVFGMVSVIIGDLFQVSAPEKSLSFLQTRCANALLTTTKQGVKGLDERFRGVREGLQAS